MNNWERFRECLEGEYKRNMALATKSHDHLVRGVYCAHLLREMNRIEGVCLMCRGPLDGDPEYCAKCLRKMRDEAAAVGLELE